MDIAILTAKLRDRLLRVLQNPAIDEASLSEAVSDTAEIIGARDVPWYLSLDIAIYRYRIRQKIQPGETEQKLYDIAYKKVLTYPIIEDDNSATQKVSPIKVGNRISEWDA